jgi:hypothetical protein
LKKAKKPEKTEPGPFTLLEGSYSTFEDPQVFRVAGGVVRYNFCLASDRDDIQLKIFVPLVVQVERNGEPQGTVNLGILKLAHYRKLFQDEVQKAWGTTRTCPQTIRIPLQQANVKGMKFNVVLKAEKEVKP